MRVLIGCEFSAIVRKAFSSLGHDAWSCDLLHSEEPGNHFKLDVFDAIGNNCFGYGWDLIILHPPCTKISLCGNSTYGNGMPKHNERIVSNDSSIPIRAPRTEGNLAMAENGLPKLEETNNVYDKMMKLPRPQRERLHFMGPSADRGHERSRTFQGIANAMAEQWGVCK